MGLRFTVIWWCLIFMHFSFAGSSSNVRSHGQFLWPCRGTGSRSFSRFGCLSCQYMPSLTSYCWIYIKIYIFFSIKKDVLCFLDSTRTCFPQIASWGFMLRTFFPISKLRCFCSVEIRYKQFNVILMYRFLYKHSNPFPIILYLKGCYCTKYSKVCEKSHLYSKFYFLDNKVKTLRLVGILAGKLN